MRALWVAASLGGVTLLSGTDAFAQAPPTWDANRTTPTLGEVLVVDATGDPSWPFGAEDVAGDGVTFGAAETSVDARSVAVARGNAALWVRLYLSGAEAPPSELVAYVFIDADSSPTSGGEAFDLVATPGLTADPSPGGYEFFVAVPADGAAPELWQWSGSAWEAASAPANALESEVGADDDPLLLASAQHGYVQVAIDFGTAGLNATCGVNLYFRTTAIGVTASDGDLEVGEPEPCAPADANANGVPDVVEPPDCSTDADCPGDGICVDGECLLPVSCLGEADCASDEICVDGVCVAQPGGACAEDSDCATLFCDDGVCGPCATDADCDPGRCAPDGSCVSVTAGTGGTSGVGGTAGTAGVAGEEVLVLGPGEEVRGGACTCTVPVSRRASHLPVLALSAVVAVAAARRRRS